MLEQQDVPVCAALQKLPFTIDESVSILQGPTATLKLGGIPRLGLTELLLGNFPGTIGSTYTLIIFACLIYLIARNAAKWYLTLSYLIPVALLSAVNHPYGVDPLESIANEMFAGSLFFVSVYLLNDPVTTPKYRIARDSLRLLCRTDDHVLPLQQPVRAQRRICNSADECAFPCL